MVDKILLFKKDGKHPKHFDKLVSIKSVPDLRRKLSRITFNNPKNIFWMASALFGLEVIQLKDEDVLKMLEIRNKYIHNNGDVGVSFHDFLFFMSKLK